MSLTPIEIEFLLLIHNNHNVDGYNNRFGDDIINSLEEKGLIEFKFIYSDVSLTDKAKVFILNITNLEVDD